MSNQNKYKKILSECSLQSSRTYPFMDIIRFGRRANTNKHFFLMVSHMSPVFVHEHHISLRMHEFYTNYIYMRYIFISHSTGVLLMASTKIDNKKKEKKTNTKEWDERVEHQKDDENVNAVSDKAKNLKQSLEWANECVRRKSCMPHRLVRRCFRLLVAIVYAAPFFECSLFILTRHFHEKLSLPKGAKWRAGNANKM